MNNAPSAVPLKSSLTKTKPPLSNACSPEQEVFWQTFLPPSGYAWTGGAHRMRRKRRNEETLTSAIFMWPSMTDVIAAAFFRHVTYHMTRNKLGRTLLSAHNGHLHVAGLLAHRSVYQTHACAHRDHCS